MNTVIRVENVSKQYRLGQISTGSMAHDINRWWYAIRGKENPYLKIGEENDRTKVGNGDYAWALQDISFDVKQGEVWGIIGRNGAGKSTLLKLLSRTTLPTKGSIKAKGRIASLLEVGTGFHPDLSGRDNIFLNGAILGMTKNEIKSKFDEIIDFAGIEKYIDTPVKRYSSGMYVRLAFAVAAHLEPEILVVDEVLAVGDAEFQKKCLGKMKDVSVNDGRTVLFVSHNMAAISTLCNKGLLLQNGKIVEAGETKRIIDLYVSTGKTSEGELFDKDIKISKTHNHIKFRRIALVGEKGVSNSFGLNEDITCEIEYELLRDNMKVFPSLHLLNTYGDCILASINSDSANLIKDPLYDEIQQSGVYKVSCVIPKFFLNDSRYSLNIFLSADSNFQDMTYVEEVLAFEVHETGEMRKEHSAGWIGYVRPKLEWGTIRKS